MPNRRVGLRSFAFVGVSPPRQPPISAVSLWPGPPDPWLGRRHSLTRGRVRGVPPSILEMLAEPSSLRWGRDFANIAVRVR